MERIITRFTRALDSYDRQAVAQQQISRRLTGLLSRYTAMHFQRVLEIGCGTGGFTRLLKESCIIDEWYLNDLCEGCREKITLFYPRECGRYRVSGLFRPDRLSLRFPMGTATGNVPAPTGCETLSRRHTGVQYLCTQQSTGSPSAHW